MNNMTSIVSSTEDLAASNSSTKPKENGKSRKLTRDNKTTKVYPLRSRNSNTEDKCKESNEENDDYVTHAEYIISIQPKSLSSDESGESDNETTDKKEDVLAKRIPVPAKTVIKHLKKLGIDTDRVSGCIKAAMANGHVRITGEPIDLQRLVITGWFQDHKYKVFLKDIIYQPDYGGNDYDCSDDAPATCICCAHREYPQHAYVTNLCNGYTRFDNGKDHNHCNGCKEFGEFGKCIGSILHDYCDKCNKHSSYPCYPCETADRLEQVEDLQEREFLRAILLTDSWMQ